ncbi:MAG: SDR family oxidoreductase [Steroidobacteraceae bacterium]|nr:SDR family oxidoreductase [Steroidobacteraceae bacterium]
MSVSRGIVITGSTRGIGKGMALEFLRRGHRVVISGRSPAAVAATVNELLPHARGPQLLSGIACDVARHDELERLWSESRRFLGAVDIWINNAGVSPVRRRIGELRGDDIRQTEEINLLGMIWATRIALLGMADQPNGGYIYNMEGFGSNGMKAPGMGLYGASKFALTYFTKCVVAETRGSKVKVCYLSPGIVLTDLLRQDMRGVEPRDSERAKRVYNILGDRVETVTPWLVERVLANERTGVRIAWLTGRKAAARFLLAPIRRRQIVTSADEAHA